MKNALEVNELRIFWEIDSISILDESDETDKLLIEDFEKN